MRLKKAFAQCGIPSDVKYNNLYDVNWYTMQTVRIRRVKRTTLGEFSLSMYMIELSLTGQTRCRMERRTIKHNKTNKNSPQSFQRHQRKFSRGNF